MKKSVLIVLLFFMSVVNMYAQYVPHDGDIDSTFGVNGSVGFATGFTWGVTIFPDDAIIEVGSQSLMNGSLMKFTKNGLADSTFGTCGSLACFPFSYIELPAIGSKGEELLMSCESGNKTSETEGWFENGTLDSALLKTSKVGNSFYYEDICRFIPVQPDGKYIVAGTGYIGDPFYQDYQTFLIRYNNGIIDSSFCNCGTGIVVLPDTPYITAVALQTDGKILAGGYQQNFSSYSLLRYTAIGLPDATFGNNGIVTLPQSFIVYSLHASASGEILAAGADTLGFVLISLTASGTIDKAFGQNGQVRNFYPDSIHSKGSQPWRIFMAVQPDNKIILAGTGYHFASAHHGTPYVVSAAISRYNQNGTIDSTFGVNGQVVQSNLCTGCENILTSLGLQSNGDIIVSNNYSDSLCFITRYIANTPHTMPVNNGDFTLSVYPNPSSGHYTIRATNLKNKTAIAVTDLVGKVMYKTAYDFSTSPTLDVDLTAYPTGIYFLKVLPALKSPQVVKLLKE